MISPGRIFLSRSSFEFAGIIRRAQWRFEKFLCIGGLIFRNLNADAAGGECIAVNAQGGRSLATNG
jgi:hypothetical protein